MVSPGRVAFTVFGLDVMWYGLLIGMAFLICGAIAMKRAPKHGVDPDHFLDVLLWTVPAAIVGARAYYVIFSWDQYKDNLKSIFDTRSGGLAIHGGLILCFLVAYIICKRRNEKPLSVFDLASVCIPLGQAIGRWGNFFNSEAHGGPTDLPWAQIIDGVGYHPTFLYESIWCFLMFIFLLWFDNHKRTFDGQILSFYMILYSFERFFVEGLRTDSLMIGSLRQAQLISIAIFVGGLALYVWCSKRQAEHISDAISVAVNNAIEDNNQSEDSNKSEED